MIVCHQYQFIFLKSRKTAGTSLEIALSKYCGPGDIITRISKEDEATRRNLGYRGAQNFWIPLSRFQLSDWRKLLLHHSRPYLRNHLAAVKARQRIGDDIWNRYFKFSIERNPWDKAISLYYWFTRAMQPRPSLMDFLETPKYRRALSNHYIYTIGDTVIADHVMRYENLDTEVEALTQRLNLPGKLELPHAKASVRPDHRHYSEVIGEAERVPIEQACAREIALFGYRFETKTGKV